MAIVNKLVFTKFWTLFTVNCLIAKLLIERHGQNLGRFPLDSCLVSSGDENVVLNDADGFMR